MESSNQFAVARKIGCAILYPRGLDLQRIDAGARRTNASLHGGGADRPLEDPDALLQVEAARRDVKHHRAKREAERLAREVERRSAGARLDLYVGAVYEVPSRNEFGPESSQHFFKVPR